MAPALLPPAVMPRAIWKGAISFGLVTVPIGLYAATESKGELSFRLLHARDGSRVEYKRFCQAEGVEVPWPEIVKGYEYEKGQYVVLEDKDFEKARVTASETFEVRDFVPAESIDYLYFDHPYYLAPTGKSGAKAYALLRDALQQSKRVGVGTIVLRQREHLAALEPAGEALVLTTMRFAHEIRSPGELDLPAPRSGWDPREMDLALKLIATLAANWEPERYQDTYRDVLLKIIEQKVEGKEVALPAPRKPARVGNLVKALEASLKTPRRDLARAPERAARPAGGRRKRRAA